MSDVERLWVGDEGIHPDVPIDEYKSAYLECVRASDYDALAARLAEAAKYLREARESIGSYECRQNEAWCAELDAWLADNGSGGT